MRLNPISSMLKAVFLLAAFTALAGCQKPEDTAGKGPAEIAGRQIDKAAVEIGKGLKEAAGETGKAIEKAGERMQEKAQEAQK